MFVATGAILLEAFCRKNVMMMEKIELLSLLGTVLLGCFGIAAAGTLIAASAKLGLVFVVLAKSPFLLQEVAVENGVGLNPLLQDPWMAIHPSIIFLGYALLAVPFACSATALIEGQPAKAWLETARRWALAAWAFLGAGIFIGGYWAYKVLGWGGFWGWDPVENSSLVPWLVAGIFIHVLRVARVRAAALSMVHLAAIFAFSLVLYGTFLTRSGILGDFSVHSFSGTSIGMTIAVVNALVLVGGLLLLTVRAGKLPQGEMYPAYDSREFLVLLGALLLVFIAAVIFLGMSMPLLTQLLRMLAWGWRCWPLSCLAAAVRRLRKSWQLVSQLPSMVMKLYSRGKSLLVICGRNTTSIPLMAVRCAL